MGREKENGEREKREWGNEKEIAWKFERTRHGESQSEEGNEEVRWVRT